MARRNPGIGIGMWVLLGGGAIVGVTVARRVAARNAAAKSTGLPPGHLLRPLTEGELALVVAAGANGPATSPVERYSAGWLIRTGPSRSSILPDFTGAVFVTAQDLERLAAEPIA